jgi:hypothetical protein
MSTDRQKMFDDLAPTADLLRELGKPSDLAKVSAALDQEPEPASEPDCT